MPEKNKGTNYNTYRNEALGFCRLKLPRSRSDSKIRDTRMMSELGFDVLYVRTVVLVGDRDRFADSEGRFSGTSGDRDPFLFRPILDPE